MKNGNESADFARGNYAIPSARESFGAAKMRRDLPLRDILSFNAYLDTELNLDQMRRRGGLAQSLSRAIYRYYSTRIEKVLLSS